MKKLTVLLIIILTVTCAFTAQRIIIFSVPQNFPAPVYDFKQNPLSAAKIELGKQLFFDPILSKDNTISCTSCHLPQTSFTHVDHDLSHGIYGRIGTRNSPALINLAWEKEFMWDGSVHNLDVQSLAPITNPNEMDETLENVVRKLQGINNYKQLYKEAFGDTIVTGQHTLQALSQFMLTLISAGSQYDKVTRGEQGRAFNEYESKGYELFKQNCASCHKEPLFSSSTYENNGLEPDTTLNDIGREKITGDKKDRGRFKVPTLRNIEVTYPYMHDGRYKNLQMVLFHYTNGIHEGNTLSAQLKKAIVFSEDDKHNLIAFLKTLTDEQFLHNPQNQLTK